MDFQTRIQLYQGGTFLLHFEDEEEYRLFLRKRRAIWIASGLFAFFAILALVSAVLCLLWLKRLYWLIVVVIVAAVLAAVIMAKMENLLYERYKNLTYNLVFKELKRRNYRITYNNDQTGAITYIEDGKEIRIYVFKGKNAKGLRRSRRK